MRELRWYLEAFLDYPFHPETLRAEAVTSALSAWGTDAFNAIFDRLVPGRWLPEAPLLQIRSDSPNVLSWPWEALRDPRDTASFAQKCPVQRTLNLIHDPKPAGDLPTDRVNILLVVARPFERDVGYRSIARPLIELIRRNKLAAHVDVLRPPTFNQLRAHLRAHPSFYHVLHFDGHGSYCASWPTSSGSGPLFSKDQFKRRQGQLYFETAAGTPDPKLARDLSLVLAEFNLPAVVLNACQSAQLDDHAEDAFASVATALLANGVRSVVAMAYSLYVSGAQVFLPAFYEGLFRSRSIATATLEGRQAMLADKNRVCARGRFPLEDWLLPVLYEQEPVDFSFVASPVQKPYRSVLPREIADSREPYGFIGRDNYILALERALHARTPAILIQGLGGVGKSTLARGFLRWLDETGGIDAALWFDFCGINSAEFVLDTVGQTLCGDGFRVGLNKLELLADKCNQNRIILVWDNFEFASDNIPTDDLRMLEDFLDRIQATRSKVLITSRDEVPWLTSERRRLLRLAGLDGEERWEYCDAILYELGLKVPRSDALVRLINQLGGNPLLMRGILPKLEAMSAAQVSNALESNLAALSPALVGEDRRTFAALQVVAKDLIESSSDLLSLIGMHDAFVDTVTFEQMARLVDRSVNYEKVFRLLNGLRSAGLLARAGSVYDARSPDEHGHTIFELHPLLSSFLRQREEPPARVRRAFVTIMSHLSDAVVRKPMGEKRTFQKAHEANMRRAAGESEALDDMPEAKAVILRLLVVWAKSSRRLSEAQRLAKELQDYIKRRSLIGWESAAHRLLGEVKELQEDFEAAGEHFTKALQFAEAEGDRGGAAASHGHLGRLAGMRGDFVGANEHYAHSANVDDVDGAKRSRAVRHHNCSILAWKNGDLVSALEHVEMAISIKEELGDPEHTASSYYLRGQLAFSEQDYSTSKHYAELALENVRDHSDMAAVHLLVGQICYIEGKNSSARDHFVRCVNLNELVGNYPSAAAGYHQLGMVAADEGSWKEAGLWLIKALKSQSPHDHTNRGRTMSVWSKLIKHAPAPDRQWLLDKWRSDGLGLWPRGECSD